jgi:translation initiation factor eIF-2B subunit delta
MYAERRICGSNARCVALLCALKRVISDYQTPPNMHISRHLQTYLSPQINYLVGMRPMSVSMGNAIRYLKYEISLLDVERSDEECKAHLIQRIDAFINERILRADEELVEHALRKIQDGDVVLTFAR